MAMTGIQLVMTLEGIVGNTIGGAYLNYPQAIPCWLRAMKELILFHARNIEDSFILDIYADLDDTEDAISTGAAAYVLGILGKSVDTAATVIVAANDNTITPPGDALTTKSVIYMPAAAATTPTFGAVVHYPYQTFETEASIFGGKASDMATAPGTAGELKAWLVRRDE